MTPPPSPGVGLAPQLLTGKSAAGFVVVAQGYSPGRISDERL